VLLVAPVVAEAGGGGDGHGGGGYHGGYGGYHGYYGGYRGGYGYGFGVGIYLGGAYPYGAYGGYPLEYYAAPYVVPAAPLPVAPPPAVPGPLSPAVGEPATGSPPPRDLTAHVAVKVPADAEVWFGQRKTRQAGVLREFVSPELTPGAEYTYEVRARWLEGGNEVVRARQLAVSAGAWTTVDFTRPAAELVEPPKPKP
jgi:uncharacterized protein (TIGR03000 family)